MKTVICGFGSAGYSAAMTLKKIENSSEIIVIDIKEKDLLHPCGLPYALEGTVNDELLTQNLDLAKSGITRFRGRAVKISETEKKVSWDDGKNTVEESFDKIIITSGASPVMPAIKKLDKYLNLSVFTLAGLRDLSFIRERMKTAEKSVVIGGGAIGIEAAFALKCLGQKVTIVEKESRLLGMILDPDISTLFENYLESSGITLIKGYTVTAFEGDECLKQVLCGDFHIPADMALISAGFRPEIGIAANSGIVTGPQGIITDQYLKTSMDGVYAAGDCISGFSSVDGKPVVSRLATSAYKQGSIAAANVLGRNEIYRGSAGTFVTKTGSFEVAGTGFNTETARARGFEPDFGKITSKIRPEYYPDNSDVTVKIIFDRNTGIILGAQCAGERGAAERINLISMAIEFGITIDELPRTELAYVPSVSEVYDPLIRAADFCIRKMRRV